LREREREFRVWGAGGKCRDEHGGSHQRDKDVRPTIADTDKDTDTDTDTDEDVRERYRHRKKRHRRCCDCRQIAE
jgi:hypothetical protein